MRLFFIFLGFTTLIGCNLTTGASVSVEVIIVDINGSTIRLEHESVPKLPASIEEFAIDPNHNQPIKNRNYIDLEKSKPVSSAKAFIK